MALCNVTGEAHLKKKSTKSILYTLLSKKKKNCNFWNLVNKFNFMKLLKGIQYKNIHEKPGFFGAHEMKKSLSDELKRKKKSNRTKRWRV